MKNIKAAIKGYKVTKELMKQFKPYRNTKEKLIDTVVVDGKKVNVYHNNEMIRSYGVLLGAAVFTGIRHEIMVDDYYLNAPKEVQDFILHHECGHIYNKDLCKNYFKRIYAQLVGLGNGETVLDMTLEDRYANMEREYNADMYAVFMCGREAVEKGIRYIWSLVPNEELIERNKRIGGLTPLVIKDNILGSSLRSLWDSATVMSIDELTTYEYESEVM